MIKWIFLASVLGDINGLRLTYLDVPDSVPIGHAVRLKCAYELEGDTLYSVKWYRDDMEFYRYVPSDKPPGQFFPLNGIKVDIAKSQNGTVYIRDVSRQTAGQYRCEVSADAPSFQTVAAERIMNVEMVTSASSASFHLNAFFAIFAILSSVFLSFLNKSVQLYLTMSESHTMNYKTNSRNET